jgi:ABC-type amino acid transport substrate-binding protein
MTGHRRLTFVLAAGDILPMKAVATVVCALGLLLSPLYAPPAAAATGAALFLGNKSLPPMNFIENGTPRGLVVDLVRAAARHMSRPVEIRLMDWADAQRLVLDGSADALIQINPDSERLKLMDFSEPLLTSEFAIFTAASRLGIVSLEDLRDLRVGVERKGLPVLIVSRDPRIVKVEIPDIAGGFAMIEAGTVDAVIADRWAGTYVLARSGLRGMRIAETPVETSSSAIAVKKGNAALLQEINLGLEAIRSDGTYDRILRSWTPQEVVYRTRGQMAVQADLLMAISVAFVLALIGVAALVTAVRRRQRAERALEGVVRE